MNIHSMYASKMAEIIGQNRTMDAYDIMGKVVEAFYQDVVSEDDQKLLNLAFQSKVSQEELDEFLSNWDIERFGASKALMLSYVMKLHPHLSFPPYVGPRITGLLNFYRFSNLQLIQHYTKIGREYNKVGIVPMILKGGAMKYLRPDLSRCMGDIDVLLDSKASFKKSCAIAKALGYVWDDNLANHSIDLHLPDSDKGVMDVHSYLDLGAKYNKKFLKQLFGRAKRANIFNVDSYVPSVEDMVFIGLLNMTKNLRARTSVAGILYTLFDVKYLKSLKPDFDWNIVLNNIKQTHTQAQMYIAMKFANRVIKGILPEELLQDESLKQSIVNCCNAEIFYNKYVHEVKFICKQLRWTKSLKSWNDFKYYINNEVKHFVVKHIRKSQYLINMFLKVVENKGL